MSHLGVAARLALIAAVAAGVGASAGACSKSGDGGGGAPASTGSFGGFGGAGGFATSTTGVTTGPTSGSGGAGGGDCSVTVTNIPIGDCDIFLQDCPVGQTCQPNTFTSTPTSTVCAPSTGLKGAGEACMVNDECAPGLFCVDECTPACCQATNYPCGGGACNVDVTFGGNVTVRMCAYDKSCNLLTADACSPGTECHISDATQGLATCSTPSTQEVDEGGPCTYINDCHDMQACYDSDNGAGTSCHWYCFVDPTRGTSTPGLGGCPAGQHCVASISGSFGIPGVSICN
jgi:hypothetical protein